VKFWQPLGFLLLAVMALIGALLGAWVHDVTVMAVDAVVTPVFTCASVASLLQVIGRELFGDGRW
jgi:hypothetical protein